MKESGVISAQRRRQDASVIAVSPFVVRSSKTRSSHAQIESSEKEQML